MPIHDWNSAHPGLFHHFHQRWISALSDRLNAGSLPPGYCALAELHTQGLYPDVTTLESQAHAEVEGYAARSNHLAIHYPLGDLVAVIEIVSPGDKANRASLRQIVKKTVAFLRHSIHVLIIDLFPPSKRDPQGIHKLIWDEIDEQQFELPADKPLTLASYAAGTVNSAYVEPVAGGHPLPDMPLFLLPDRYVLVPLESTYMETWEKCPEQFRQAVAGKPES
jgi:hypothetical protein